jgi:hypothetical protein
MRSPRLQRGSSGDAEPSVAEWGPASPIHAASHKPHSGPQQVMSTKKGVIVQSLPSIRTNQPQAVPEAMGAFPVFPRKIPQRTKALLSV